MEILKYVILQLGGVFLHRTAHLIVIQLEKLTVLLGFNFIINKFTKYVVEFLSYYKLQKKF